MKTIAGALLLAVMVIMPPATGHGQEKSPNQATQDSGAEVKKNVPSVLEGITDIIQTQKEKYQKDIQDQIQNKVKFVEDKFNAIKSLAGKTEPEKVAKQETASTPVQADKQGAEKTSAEGQTAKPASGLWGKLNALQEATMAFIKQLMNILFQ
jgi:hypothetical protein